MTFDVLVIGAGVVGSLLARELSSYELDTLVIEKENDVGNGVSKANSAIVHSGYDPVPGTLKAKLNVWGNSLFTKEFIDDLDVKVKRIGSLTIALTDDQVDQLKELQIRSKQNGVDVQILDKEQTLEIEPNLSLNVKSSLFAPSCGIVDPFTLTVHAMENAVDNGVKLKLDEEVLEINKKGLYYEVKTNKDTYFTKVVINCAGLNSEDIHKMVEDIDYKITARKGEYFILDHFSKDFINHVIFTLPSEKGKGVLVSPTTSGNYIIGPSAEVMEDKEDLATDKQTLDSVRNQALDMVPSIPFNQAIRTFAGNRPTPSTHDFIIGYSKNDDHFINCSGIESPGLVSSPAIAKYVVEEYLSKILELKPNQYYNPKLRKRVHLDLLTPSQRDELIKKNPNYGRIICNCEKISLGEILDELSRSVPPHSVASLRKRTRAGFGKCQGSFCQPLVIAELAKSFDVKLHDIDYDRDDSVICKYETKTEAE